MGQAAWCGCGEGTPAGTHAGDSCQRAGLRQYVACSHQRRACAADAAGPLLGAFAGLHTNGSTSYSGAAGRESCCTCCPACCCQRRPRRGTPCSHRSAVASYLSAQRSWPDFFPAREEEPLAWLGMRHVMCIDVQVGGDSMLKALSAAEYNSPDAEASAPVLQAFAVVIR